MQLKFSKDNVYADCFESVLACFAININRRYEWMYLNEWRFSFKPLSVGTMCRLGLGLELHRDKVGPLTEFHGIRYYQQECENFEDLGNILQKKLDVGMPIAVRVDAYYCPWDKSFGIYHNSNHIFLLNGFEENLGNIFCSDPFYNEWNRKISLIEFSKIYAGQYGMFDVSEDISSMIDGIQIFKIMLQSLFEEGTFESIRKLAEEIEKTDDFKNEINNETAVWFAPIFRRMIEIANSRGRLPKYIIFMAKQYRKPELLSSLPLLEEIREEWKQVRDLTLKILMTNKMSIKEKLTFKINKLASMEEKAALILLGI